MNIQPGSTIAGRPAKEARDLLVKLRRGWLKMNDRVLSAEQIALEAGEDMSSFASYLDGLVEAGLLRVVEGKGYTESGHTLQMRGYDTTEAGNRLTTAKVGKRFARSEGDKIIDAIIERIASVNVGDFTTTIHRAEVFGSYARGATDLGDVDVLIYTRSRWADEKERLIQGDAWLERNEAFSIADIVSKEGRMLDQALTKRQKRIHLIRVGENDRIEWLIGEDPGPRIQIFPNDERQQ